MAVAVAQEPARERPLRAMAVGIGEDYASNRRTPDAARRDLDACRRRGVGAEDQLQLVRDGAPARAVRLRVLGRGRADGPDEYGLRLIPYVCYTPGWASSEPESQAVWTTPPKDLAAFGRFVGALVDRNKGRIASWEIWNEPDIPEFWTDSPRHSPRMLAEGSRTMSPADPTARVVLGGIARRPEYLRELLRDEGCRR